MYDSQRYDLGNRHRRFETRWENYFRFYRLLFNLAALVTIIPVILYARSLHAPVIFRWKGLMIILQILLLGMGIWLFIAGAKHNDMLQFFRQHE